jgi:hypothetical protein
LRREPSPRNPFRKKSTNRVKLRKAGGETQVLCVSSERKEKDRAIGRLGERYSRGARYCRMEYDAEARRAQAEKLDGSYLPKTGREDLSAGGAWRICILPTRVSIEKTLVNRGVHRSWATVGETPKTQWANSIVLPSDGGLALRIRKGTTPEPAHHELYAKLGVDPEAVWPRKTRTRDEIPK